MAGVPSLDGLLSCADSRGDEGAKILGEACPEGGVEGD